MQYYKSNEGRNTAGVEISWDRVDSGGPGKNASWQIETTYIRIEEHRSFFKTGA